MQQQGPSYSLSAKTLINAKIINVKGSNRHQKIIIRGFSEQTEGIAKHDIIVTCENENRLQIPTTDLCLEFHLRVLRCRALEQVGSGAMVHHIHLKQQVQEARDIFGFGISDHVAKLIHFITFVSYMYSFTCDYNEGAHPAIIRRLAETNLVQEPGYGEDDFCASAAARIRDAAGCPGADVFFLTGGTQTNYTVIDGMLRQHEGVIAAQTGHIAVHEAGAVEFSGHKVLTLPQHEGKIDASELRSYLETFYQDDSHTHMVYPGMVYISFPTEYGTIYSRAELQAIKDVCMDFNLSLFVDGARLGYGLASPAADIDMKDLARLCDVFYIGGTKVGALCGEAVVFPRGNAPEHFFTIMKQHGALLAKGRLLGVQFDTLFTDGLYEKISAHAIEMAMRLKEVFVSKGIPFYIDSPTNQQFPILSAGQIDSLLGPIGFEIWERRPDGSAVTRFATSWATPPEAIDALKEALGSAESK